MDDPFQLKFIFGKMGTGKSGLIAIMSIKDMQDPRFKNVYTSTGVPGTRKFNPEDISKGFTFPPYSSVYIDEFGLVNNSRDFAKFTKTERRWWKFMRQSRLKVTIFSQAPDVDKSIRDLAHSYGLLRRVGPFSILFDVSKNIDVGSDIQGNGQLIDDYFKHGLLGGMHIFYLPRYFGLWDSFSPPKMPLIESEYINPTPQLLRSMRLKKWYKWDLDQVYSGLIGSVAAIKTSIHNKYLFNTFYLKNRSFIKIQLLSNP